MVWSVRLTYLLPGDRGLQVRLWRVCRVCVKDKVVSVASDEHYVCIKKSMSPYKGLGMLATVPGLQRTHCAILGHSPCLSIGAKSQACITLPSSKQSWCTL